MPVSALTVSTGTDRGIYMSNVKSTAGTIVFKDNVWDSTRNCRISFGAAGISLRWFSGGMVVVIR
jgi:hypothetical protein